MNEIKEIIKQKLSDMRKLDYYIHSERFRVIYECCSEESRNKLLEAVKDGSLESFTQILSMLLAFQVEHYNIKQLRKKAACLGISSYWCLPKVELLKRIINAQSIQTSHSDRGIPFAVRSDVRENLQTPSEEIQVPSETPIEGG